MKLNLSRYQKFIMGFGFSVILLPLFIPMPKNLSLMFQLTCLMVGVMVIVLADLQDEIEETPE